LRCCCHCLRFQHRNEDLQSDSSAFSFCGTQYRVQSSVAPRRASSTNKNGASVLAVIHFATANGGQENDKTGSDRPTIEVRSRKSSSGWARLRRHGRLWRAWPRGPCWFFREGRSTSSVVVPLKGRLTRRPMKKKNSIRPKRTRSARSQRLVAGKRSNGAKKNHAEPAPSPWLRMFPTENDGRPR
jgi:hypothetical protein